MEELMIRQNAWICSNGSTLSSVMVEVECGTTVFYSTEEQARRALNGRERVYYVTITVSGVPDE
jgi:predicted Holliday junction resolvase-like endonuclease